MLCKKLSLETSVKNIRNRRPLKQVPRKSATKNNDIERLLKMLRKPPLQTLSKISVRECR